MKRVTIYVDDKVWEEIKAYTWELSVDAREKVSVGNYLTGLHLKYGGKVKEESKDKDFFEEAESIAQEVYDNILVKDQR